MHLTGSLIVCLRDDKKEGKMLYLSSVTCGWVILWLNVLNVERKWLLLESLGRWLVKKIRVAREQSLL